MITFTANIRSASAATDDAITTSSVGIPVTLDLSADFDGLAKTLCFKTPSAAVDIALTGDATESAVPPDVLVRSGEWLNIGIYAADSNGDIVIPTVWANAGVIQLGTIPSGVDPSAPTPSWVAQVQQMAGDALNNSEQAIDTANEAKEAAITAQDSARASAAAAAQSATDAESAEMAAANSAGDAAASATAASGSVQIATEKASEAAASAAAAGTASDTATGKAVEAAQSADSAAQSAETAQNSAQAAQNAQTAAAGSASTASEKAGEAAQSASQAGNSATSASTSATAAGMAQTGAETAQTAAETAAQSVSASADQIQKNADDITDLKSAFENADLYTRTNQLIDLNNPDFWNLNKSYTMTTANGQVMSDLIPIELDTDYYCAKDAAISQYKCKLFGYDENGNYVSGTDLGYFNNSLTVNISSVTYPTVKYLRFRCTLNRSGDPGYPGAITYEQFRSYLTWINLTSGARVTDKYVPYEESSIEVLNEKVFTLEDAVFPSKSLAVDGASLTEAELNLAKSKLNALERKNFDFAWQTDTHVFDSGTDANLLNLVSAANIGDTSFIVNTGDFINGGYSPAAQMKLQLAKAVGIYKKAKCDYFQLAGNHDDNSLYYINDNTRGKRQIIGYDDWFNMVVMRMADYNIAMTTNKRYFSKLYEKTLYNTAYRFLAVCLDSGDVDYSVDDGTQFVFGFKEEQLKWLIETLSYSSYSEYVMVFVHCPIDGESTAETVHNLNLITGILEAFANHTSFSGTSTESGWEASVSCDFTGKTTQHLIGVFQGHTHVDSLVTKNNVNYVTLDNGHVANTDASGKVDAIDYVNVNVSSKAVNLIRLGGGDGVDRSFTFY